MLMVQGEGEGVPQGFLPLLTSSIELIGLRVGVRISG